MRSLLTTSQKDKKTGLYVVSKKSSGKISVPETLSSLSYLFAKLFFQDALHTGCPLGIPTGNIVAVEFFLHIQERKEERERERERNKHLSV